MIKFLTVIEITLRRNRWHRLCAGLLVSFSFVFLAILSVQAEPRIATLGVGVAFAPIGGHGFSLRKLPENGFGYQCGTIFWKNEDNSYFAAGGEVLYILKHSRLTAFYIPVGVDYSYQSQLEYRYDQSISGQSHDVRIRSTHISGGAGLGFTARTEGWEDFWFSLDLVMVADGNDILPLPQIAMHYFLR